MTEADDFICVHCGMPVSGLAWGTKHRNHCPHCLYSRHVDMRPGDRACLCKGTMQPIALWQKADGELMILHRCQTCGLIGNPHISQNYEDMWSYVKSYGIANRYP